MSTYEKTFPGRKYPRQCLTCYRIYFGDTGRTGREDAPECRDCFDRRVFTMKYTLSMKFGFREPRSESGMSLFIDTLSYHSLNYSERPQGTVIDAIVLHSGEGTKKSDLETLTDNTVPLRDRVSAHYYVDRKGNAYQLVDPRFEAWHAGASKYQDRSNWNPFSIGIETEHKEGQDWPLVQKAAIHELCVMLVARFPIQQKYVAAHRWIAIPAGRRHDPTNWTNEDLHAFIDTLFVGPSNIYHVTGLTTDMICGKGFYDLYVQLGGFRTVGYALTNEAPDTDILNRSCTWMRFERAVFKYVDGEGAHLALLTEARVKGWIT